LKQLETTGYYAFGVPLYFSLMAAEYFIARRKRAPTLSFADSVGNISAGLGAIVVGLFLGPILIALYDWGYAHFALVKWPKGSWVPWLLAVVLADFGHYWHHRLDHRVAACWAIHGVHHMPEEMNFTVAMRHAWFSDVYSWPFYSLLPLCGVPTSHFFVATTLLSFHALITHSEHYNFPSFYIFVTPRSHILHHAKNPRYIDKNFGAMLCIWDRLFGTHVEISDEEPPQYGTVRGYKTHDGALAQWVLMRDLLALAGKTRALKERLRIFFSRPGYTPPGLDFPSLKAPPKSAAIPLWRKLLVAGLLLITIAFSLYVFILRDLHSWILKGSSAAALLASLLLLGALLDKRWPVT
jgi:alkylglycerol monooxygenase